MICLHSASGTSRTGVRLTNPAQLIRALGPGTLARISARAARSVRSERKP